MHLPNKKGKPWTQFLAPPLALPSNMKNISRLRGECNRVSY